MDLFIIFVIFSLISMVSARMITDAKTLFDVMNYGAIGDGKTDDTQAFLKAWTATCGAATDSPTMVVPNGKTFFIESSEFEGPCKSNYVNVQVSGTMVAPADPSAWKDKKSTWLTFKNVNGLSLNGNGLIDGRGHQWWKQSCKIQKKSGCTTDAPEMLSIMSCTDVHLSDLKFTNSPQMHIKIDSSNQVYVDNIHINSPENSPNTDGIHIGESKYVDIRHAVIASGDDCISIGDNSLDVNVTTVVCGPGHGISIGSLGKGGSDGKVERINVKYVNFIGTTNGARIKTWQGGSGHAKQIKFENLNFTNVQNPIIIDQYYCDQDDPCKNVTTGVQISDVSYTEAKGTSATPTAISLHCDETVGCTGISLSDIKITSAVPSKPVEADCTNVHGNINGVVNPKVPCLSS